MQVWEFFKYLILPCLVGGIILGFIRFVSDKFVDNNTTKFPKLKKLIDKRPNLIYEILIVGIVIYAIGYWVANGMANENTGF